LIIANFDGFVDGAPRPFLANPCGSLQACLEIPVLDSARKEASMANTIEKRISVRHPLEGAITLHTTILTSREINAHLLNYSQHGICFSTDTKLIPGTTVLFKASRDCHLFTEEDADCQLRSISMVTVKWCHESSHADLPTFVAGANYAVPY
jgi:hypothetical protein